MSKKDVNNGVQKERTSRLAIWSLVLAGIGIGAFCIIDVVEITTLCSVIVTISSVLGLFLGIISIFLIARSKGRLKGIWFALGGIPINLGFLIMFVIGLIQVHALAQRLLCREHLSKLAVSFLIYCSDNDDNFPVAHKWCDVLVEQAGVDKRLFICKAGGESRCHYAINPNCNPNSPADTVLLFETKGGWNQFGGPELLTTENHKGKGCNILFNDAHSEFVKTEELSKLKWEVEKNSSKNR